MKYAIHSPETAPAAAKDILLGAQRGFGFIPNLLATMAGAPSLLKAYTTLAGIFEESSFSATERQVVLLATSYVNHCEYCVAAHTAIAGMQKVPADVVNAIREGNPIDNAKLQALRQLTEEIVNTRGWPSETSVKDFFSEGYDAQQVLEVVLGVGIKTLSNYTNHIAETPLDTAFEKAAWVKPA